MSFTAKVLRIMIASPSDVVRERKVIPEVINQWNAENSDLFGVVVLPIMWEIHSTPEMGERPQAIINRQVLEKADALIGAFWSRLGTPTGTAPSGTVEEIEEIRKQGKRVLLYFSKAPYPQSTDFDQVAKLKEFKSQCFQQGIVFEYRTIPELKTVLLRHLTAVVREILAKRVAADGNQGGGNVVAPADQLAEEPGPSENVSTPVEFSEPPRFSHTNTPEFFSLRMAEAFPGLRGFRSFNGVDAVNRLERLLKSPLEFSLPTGGRMTPIWWWHGHACNEISDFTVLDPESGRCLMDSQELLVDQVVAYHSNDYQRHFVYVVTRADAPCGVYEITDDDIERQIGYFGYAWEEMGYMKTLNRYITRSEYDDGFADIDGSIVDAEDASVRIRYLSPYNFFIASVHTPSNDVKHDLKADEFIKGLLTGAATVDQFAQWLEGLPRNPNVYRWQGSWT